MAGAPHLQAFLDAARYFIGLKESGTNSFPKSDPRGKEFWNLWGSNASGTSWCAMFVSVCGVKAGISGTVIGKNSGASGISKATVKLGGTWIDGPYINGGKAVIPAPGDIINFGNAQYHGHDHAYHVGIVEYVEGDKVHTIEGNSSNQCKRNVYSAGSKSINTYVRPNWAKVGDDVSAYITGKTETPATVTIGPLYQDRNDRHDMTLRQVAYLSNKYELSDLPSGIAISAINYTSALGDIYDVFVAETIGGVQVDTSQLTGNIKIATDYFISMGISGSSASALTGCLKAYSDINPAYQGRDTNNKYLYGIAAWNTQHLNAGKSRGVANWDTNLTGQLEYFMYDLYTNYKELLFMIKTQPLNISSVDHVVELVIKSYNPNKNTSDVLAKAKGYAEVTYNGLLITQPSIVGNSNLGFTDISGNELTAKYSVDIPATIKQTGIIDDYTSYSHWYSKWNKSSPQKKLAKLWGEQGFPCDKGVAMIGGYYCAAVRPKFGRCGEVIVVTLEDGTTFNAIICDEKGADAGSEWGHVKGGGKISLIEWERVKTVNGAVITTGTKNNVVDPRGFSDWYGKKVRNITNYGKYVDVKWG